MSMPNSSKISTGTYSISSNTHKDNEYKEYVYILTLTSNNSSTQEIRVWFKDRNTMFWATEQSHDLGFSRTSKKMNRLMQIIIIFGVLGALGELLCTKLDATKRQSIK